LPLAYFSLLDAVKLKSSVKYTKIAKLVLEDLYVKAKEFKDMGLFGNSYATLTYIDKIDRNYKSLFVLKRDLKDSLLKDNVLKLAVAEFTMASNDKNSGTKFTAALTTELFKTSLKDLNIIERNRLNMILDELKLKDTGNLESLAQRGKIKGLNVFVFGDIMESSVETQRVETKISKKVQIDTRKINNNEYMMYMMASDMDKKKWKTVPEQFIKEPVYQILPYTKGKVTKTANLIVSVRIVDIEKGSIIAAKTIESQDVVSDNYNEGLDMEYSNIKSDAEVIPSDKTLLNKLYKQLSSQVAQFVLTPFKQREIDQLTKADLKIQRREYNKAMEHIVKSLIIYEIKNKNIPQNVYDKEDKMFMEIIR
jgi:curli biogenesis system outer membrane secretion channel CsgG